LDEKRRDKHLAGNWCEEKGFQRKKKKNSALLLGSQKEGVVPLGDVKVGGWSFNRGTPFHSGITGRSTFRRETCPRKGLLLRKRIMKNDMQKEWVVNQKNPKTAEG